MLLVLTSTNVVLKLRFSLQVNGQNVVGLNDKEVSEIIDSAGNVVTVTVVPSYVYRHMMKNMSSSLIKKMMDHSVPDM